MFYTTMPRASSTSLQMFIPSTGNHVRVCVPLWPWPSDPEHGGLSFPPWSHGTTSMSTPTSLTEESLLTPNPPRNHLTSKDHLAE